MVFPYVLFFWGSLCLVIFSYIFFSEGLIWQFFPRFWELCVRSPRFHDLLESILLHFFLNLFPYGFLLFLDLLACFSSGDFYRLLLWLASPLDHSICSIVSAAFYEPYTPKGGEVRIARFVYVPPEHVVGSSLPRYLHGGLAGNPSDPFEYFLLYHWPYPPEDWSNPYHPRILFPYIHTYPEPKDQESEEITDTLTELIYDAYGRPKTPDDYGKAFAVTFLAFQFGYAIGFGLTALAHWLSSGK